MDKSRALKFFDKDDIIQLGHFYCGSGGTDKSCPFRIPFTFHFEKRAYFFKRVGLNLEHNHQIAAAVVDGILFKKTETELTSVEKNSIMDIAPFVSIGGLRRFLRNMWPNLGFDSALLYCLKAKGKARAFGNDKNAINAFMDKGQRIRHESGVFNVRFDESMKIEEVIVQTRVNDWICQRVWRFHFT
jgi:hypothetical protein